MSKKEKARPRRQPGTGQAETAAFDRAAISCTHSTANPAARQFRVSDFLGRGRESAIPMRTLKALLHLDGRSILQAIQAERLQGVPLLSSSSAGGGYFLASSPAEIKQFTRTMRRRAHEIERVASAVESGEIV